jgi:membrane protease YdiL (CAAX protease family)
MLYQKKENVFLEWKEELLTLVVAISCLALFSLFPTQGLLEEITVGLFFLALIPFLYIKLILKKKMAAFGWQVGNRKKGLLFGGTGFLLSLLIFYILLNYSPFLKYYTLPETIRQNFWLFLGYEFLLTAFFLALYEFFFRGFLLFSFVPKLNQVAPFFQFACLFLFFALTSNLLWSNALYVITGFFSGWTAFKSQSLIYSFLSSFLFILIADALVIKFFPII